MIEDVEMEEQASPEVNRSRHQIKNLRSGEIKMMLETMNEIKMFNEQAITRTKKNSPRMT